MDYIGFLFLGYGRNASRSDTFHCEKKDPRRNWDFAWCPCPLITQEQMRSYHALSRKCLCVIASESVTTDLYHSYSCIRRAAPSCNSGVIGI